MLADRALAPRTVQRVIRDPAPDHWIRVPTLSSTEQEVCDACFIPRRPLFLHPGIFARSGTRACYLHSPASIGGASRRLLERQCQGCPRSRSRSVNQWAEV